MQSTVIYRYIAERQKNGRYYISVIRHVGAFAKSVPLKEKPDIIQHAEKNTERLGNNKDDKPLAQHGEQASLATMSAGAAGADNGKKTDLPASHTAQLVDAGHRDQADREAAEANAQRVTVKAIAIGNADSKPVHKAAMGKLLAGSEPIALNTTTRLNPPEPGGDNLLLGELQISSSSSGWSQEAEISERTLDNTFRIHYRRPVVLSDFDQAFEVQADDAAMIARAFMLAKLATSRMGTRAILEAQTKDLKEMKQAQDEDGRQFFAPRMLAIWRKMEAEEEAEKHGHHAAAADAPVQQAAGKALLLPIENWLAIGAKALHERIHKHKNGLYAVMAGMLGLALFWVWSSDLAIWSALGWLLTGLCVAGGIVFLLYALNLKSLEHRIEEKLHERSTDRLNETMAELAQANANVAALNLQPFQHNGVVSELLLCRMDQALHVKERLTSIEAVIKARATYLNASVQHIEKHRDRVRRSITAAGSGVFVGFFTYEVGESVMSYMHVAHHQDSGAMLYWLFANNERIKVKQQHAAPAHEETAAPIHAEAAAPAPRETVAAPHTVSHGPAIDQEFLNAYHQPELYAHSWLLTLTIVFSVITAWIAIRKPEAEQGGGHGHH